MSKVNKERTREIVPLNDDWVDFDLENLNVEELEQRFELSLAHLPIGWDESESCKDNCSCLSCNDLGCCVN